MNARALRDEARERARERRDEAIEVAEHELLVLARRATTPQHRLTNAARALRRMVATPLRDWMDDKLESGSNDG